MASGPKKSVSYGDNSLCPDPRSQCGAIAITLQTFKNQSLFNHQNTPTHTCNLPVSGRSAMCPVNLSTHTHLGHGHMLVPHFLSFILTHSFSALYARYYKGALPCPRRARTHRQHTRVPPIDCIFSHRCILGNDISHTCSHCSDANNALHARAC